MSYPEAPRTTTGLADKKIMYEIARLIPYLGPLARAAKWALPFLDDEQIELNKVRVLSLKLYEENTELWHRSEHILRHQRIGYSRGVKRAATELNDTSVSAKVLVGKLRKAIGAYERAFDKNVETKRNFAKSIRNYATEAEKRAAKAAVKGISLGR